MCIAELCETMREPLNQHLTHGISPTFQQDSSRLERHPSWNPSTTPGGQKSCFTLQPKQPEGTISRKQDLPTPSEASSRWDGTVLATNPKAWRPPQCFHPRTRWRHGEEKNHRDAWQETESDIAFERTFAASYFNCCQLVQQGTLSRPCKPSLQGTSFRTCSMHCSETWHYCLDWRRSTAY